MDPEATQIGTLDSDSEAPIALSKKTERCIANLLISTADCERDL